MIYLHGQLHQHGLVRHQEGHSVNPAGVTIYTDVLHQGVDLQQALHLYSTKNQLNARVIKYTDVLHQGVDLQQALHL